MIRRDRRETAFIHNPWRRHRMMFWYWWATGEHNTVLRGSYEYGRWS